MRRCRDLGGGAGKVPDFTDQTAAVETEIATGPVRIICLGIILLGLQPAAFHRMHGRMHGRAAGGRLRLPSRSHRHRRHGAVEGEGEYDHDGVK